MSQETEPHAPSTCPCQVQEGLPGARCDTDPISPDALGQVIQHYRALFLIPLRGLVKPQTLILGMIYQ